MKKKIIVLITAALLSLSGSSAFANFGNGQLNFYAYGNGAGTSEVGVNLGSISTVLSGTAPPSQLQGPGPTTITSGESSITGLHTDSTTIYAGLYGFDAVTGNIYVAANQGLGSFNANLSSYTAFKTANTKVNDLYGATNVKTITSKGTSATSTYFGQMDKGVSGIGTLSNLIPTGYGTYFVTTLAADVTKNIYMFDITGTTFNDTGVSATLTTNGDIIIQAPTWDDRPSGSYAPIPAAAWLLGSGLIGLFGFRKGENI